MAALTPTDRALRRFLLAGVGAGDRVIDVGCGTGWTALLLSRERPGCVVDGVDADAAAVHSARAAFAQARRAEALRCHQIAAEDLRTKFPASSFDVAVSTHALHHFARPWRALREAYRVVRPGGRLLVAEYDPDVGETLDDCPRYSLWKIEELITSAGFVLRSTRRHPWGVLFVAAERPSTSRRRRSAG